MTSKLKSIVEGIIRETIVNKLINEGQPVGGVKNDHDFDEGRWGVMKAVNVGEQIGQDGKYVDDMESGVAVKKLHGLDETELDKQSRAVDKNFAKMEKDPTYRPKPFQPEERPEEKMPGKFVDRGTVKLEGGVPEEVARKIAEYHWDVFNHYKGIRDEWQFFTRGDRWCCSVGMLNGQPAMLSATTTPGRLNLLVGKELLNGMKKVDEISASGAAGGYQTPFAFSKKKSGSQRAMDVTTKMGFKKVKDID